MILLLNTRTEKIVTVKNNDNDQLIETMTSLMLIHYQYRQHGCLCLQTVVDQLKLEVTIKGVLDDWKDHSETIEGGNQVIIEHLKRHEK